jgi:hypothetical protein
MPGLHPEAAAMAARIEAAMRRRAYLSVEALANLAGWRGPHRLRVGKHAILDPLVSAAAIEAISHLQEQGKCHWRPIAGRWVVHRGPLLVQANLMPAPPTQRPTTKEERFAEIARWVREASLAPAPIVPPAWCEQWRPIPIGRPPIWCRGIGQAAIGAPPIFLYEDANGIECALELESHDRRGIRSLFGAEDELRRLWPGRGRSWKPAAAAAQLIATQARVGIVRWPARGQTPEDQRFRSELGRIVRRLLAAGRDPYLVHGLALAWNARKGRQRPPTEVTAVVNSACAAALRSEKPADRV